METVRMSVESFREGIIQKRGVQKWMQWEDRENK